MLKTNLYDRRSTAFDIRNAENHDLFKTIERKIDENLHNKKFVEFLIEKQWIIEIPADMEDEDFRVDFLKVFKVNFGKHKRLFPEYLDKYLKRENPGLNFKSLILFADGDWKIVTAISLN